MRYQFQNSQYPWLKDFKSACNKIESDPNYQPHISNRELLLLVIDENGTARHTPRRSALAIQPMKLIPQADDNNFLGVLYQIKIAKKGYTDNSPYPAWQVDNSVLILINKKGEMSLHGSEKAKKGDFSSPLSHISIDDFLDRPCLHCSEENNNNVYNF